MRSPFLVGFLLLASSAFAGCPDAAPSDAELFVRSHMVHNFNGEPPGLVEDQIQLWRGAGGEFCFELQTLGANGHECGATGEAVLVSPNKFRFAEGQCALTFALTRGRGKLSPSRGWERMGRDGACAANRCGMYGEVLPGVFTPKSTANPSIERTVSSGLRPLPTAAHVKR